MREHKKEIDFWLKKWITENPNEPAIKRDSAIIKILKIVGYNPSKLNKTIIDKAYAKYGWSKLHIWPITALKKFLAWLIKQPNIFFQIPKFITCHQKENLSDFNPQLLQELKEILDSRRSRYTGVGLSKTYKDDTARSFKIFVKIISQKHPKCSCDSIKSFRKQGYMDEFLRELEQSFQQKNNNGESSQSKIYNIACKVRNVFTYARDMHIISDLEYRNYFKIELKKSHNLTTKTAVSQSILEKLFHIDLDYMNSLDLDIAGKFRYILKKAVPKICYEFAGRVSEPTRLLETDVGINDIAPSGLIPIIIRGAKHRPPFHEDIVWIEYRKIQLWDELWRQVKKEYCKEKKIEIKSLICRKTGAVLGTPYFIDEDGEPLTYTKFSKLFKELVEETGEINEAK
ncbi:MAG: hypothetical protein WC947_08190 [Elusimicrobiota bacterium]